MTPNPADGPVYRTFVITSGFPFGTGEQFLPDEIAHWPPSLAFTVVPLTTEGPVRDLPAHVTIDTRVAEYRRTWRKVVALPLAALHPLFLADLRFLLRRRRLTWARAGASLRVVAQTLVIARALSRIVGEAPPEALVYSYWNGAPAYAGALLKRRGRVSRVVSRTHGSDLYEGASPVRWLPLKRQFVGDFDHVWAVSEDGSAAFVESFGVDPTRVSVARLGIGLPAQAAPHRHVRVLRVVTISSCTPVKQLPLLVGALRHFALEHPERQVRWTHLGGGPELDALTDEAERSLGPLTNLDYVLEGQVDHARVHEVLSVEEFDVVVNVSRSEGVPVSLMEAMSYGVPAIAPDVGGVSELVGADRGWLLSAPVSIVGVVSALEAAWETRHDEGRRVRAREFVATHFDGDRNHARFGTALARIAK